MLKIRNFGQKSVISSTVHGMQRCVKKKKKKKKKKSYVLHTNKT